MSLSEKILLALAKKMYRSNPGQSERMADALVTDESYAVYRQECFSVILDAVQKYGVSCVDKDVLDLGCYDGTITRNFLEAGAHRVIGVDIDEPAVTSAQKNYSSDRVEFRVSATTGLPLEDQSVDTIISYDVFEHVEKPAPLLKNVTVSCGQVERC